MLDLADRPRLGPYILTRELLPTSAFGLGEFSPLGLPGSSSGLPQPERYLALHSSNHTSHVAYRFPAVPVSGTHAWTEQRRFQAAAEHAAGLAHPHILTIQQVGVDTLGHPWLITPFTGDVDGLRTLAKLQKEKGGQLAPMEVERAAEQLLSAAAAAHGQHVTAHGPIHIEEILVDRHGAIVVELYALARSLLLPPPPPPQPSSPSSTSPPSSAASTWTRPGSELIRDEVRSIVEIAYQLITGLRAEEPVIPAHRVVPHLPRDWTAWLEQGLNPTRGFDSAAQALAALPGRATAPGRPARPLTRVRQAFARLRS
jgi:hypothetical protein